MPFRPSSVCTVSFLLLSLAVPAHAVDGVIEINQAKAIVGLDVGVDAPLFPVTISEPGSYRLTSSLEPPAGGAVNLIEISASDVSLDLNGFSLQGDNVCTGTAVPPVPIIVSCSGAGNSLNGIVVSGGVTGITIRNGTIRGMLLDGISATSASGMSIDGVFSTSNGEDCLDLGEGTQIRDTGAALCGGSGVVAGAAFTMEQGGASSTGGIGILAGHGATLEATNAARNAGDGIVVGNSSRIRASLSSLNDGFGISTGTVSVVTHSTSNNNTMAGISAGNASVLDRNTSATNTADGIVCGDACTITYNVVTNNVDGANTADGIETSSRNTVIGNSAQANDGVGINLGTDSLYEHNNASGNVSGTITGGVSMGDNVCDGVKC